MRPTELRCEYAVDPLGIDARQPRLSWQTPAEPCGYRQSAYQVVVAGSMAALRTGGELFWDSGKVVSERSVNVPYAGRELGSGERCCWQVRTWDREDRAGAWSEAAWFELGLLAADDWQGAWIAAQRGISAPLLRTEFTLAAAPARARVYLSGLGYYELRINGAKVGRQVLDPASTYYHNDLELELGSRVLYTSHDVSGHLRAGRNAVGVMLGNGWYAAEADVPPSPSHRKPYGEQPRLLLQLEVEPVEGEPVRVVSGTGWKASAGPVRYNDYSHGESYDARREQAGWDTPGYDDSAWSAAQEVAAPSGMLRAQPLAPCEVVETRTTQQVLRPRAGVAVYDFGQNFSGWSRLRVQGERGARVVLKHGARVYRGWLAGRPQQPVRPPLHPCRAPARQLHAERARSGRVGAALHPARVPLRGGERLAGDAASGAGGRADGAQRRRTGGQLPLLQRAAQPDPRGGGVDLRQQPAGVPAGRGGPLGAGGVAGGPDPRRLHV